MSDANGHDPQRVGNLIGVVAKYLHQAEEAHSLGNTAAAMQLLETALGRPIGAEYTHNMRPAVGDQLQKIRDRAEAADLYAAELAGDGCSTWETYDLGPIIAGDTTLPEPDVGLTRQDGLFMLYQGREHAVIGDLESGKTWFACACAARELRMGNRVAYIHYEEPGKLGAISTVERLSALGVDNATLRDTGRFRFVGPSRPVRGEWLAALLDFTPTLVIHDGVNEAMALHGAEIRYAEGASDFRRRLIVPCLEVGAATLATDHLPHNADAARAGAYGSIHKGNALNGARFLLEKKDPFGRGARGRSHLFVTKDRPGYLRRNGNPDTDVPGKAYLGTFIVDASNPFTPLEAFLTTPKPEDVAKVDPGAAKAAEWTEFMECVRATIAAQPDRTIKSCNALYSALRKSGHAFADSKVDMAVAGLESEGRLKEIGGPRNAKGYRATTSAKDDSE